MKYLWTLLLLVLVSAPVQAERITNLPEMAAGRYYLTVVYSAGWSPKDRELHEFLRKDEVIKQMCDVMVFNEWTSEKPIFSQTPWREYIGSEFPAVLIQGPALPDGRAHVIFFANGRNLLVGTTLRISIYRAIEDYAKYTKEQPVEQWRPRCPDGKCPLPRRNRQPSPEPNEDEQPLPPANPTPPVVPISPTTVVEPVSEETTGGVPLWAYALPIVGAGLGIWSQLRKQS